METRQTPAGGPFALARWSLWVAMAATPAAGAGTEVEVAAAGGSAAAAVPSLLVDQCYDCHGGGEKRGGVALDEAAPDGKSPRDPELWAKALKNVRAGLMPPPRKGKLSADEVRQLEGWLKHAALGLDPAAPDPGRVTLRRLNRTEYRNTVRDLMGVNFRADEEFPADDTGHGFDNIGDVLTVSPMLLEKYLAAAGQIVAEAVPETDRVVAERTLPGKAFRPVATSGPAAEGATATTRPATRPAGTGALASRPAGAAGGTLALSYYEPAAVAAAVTLEHAGAYTLVLEMAVKGKYAEKGFDYNRCEVAFSADGTELVRQSYGWDQKRELRFEFPAQWQAGEHRFAVSLKPLTRDLPRHGELEMQLVAVRLSGPLERQHWVRPKGYERFFGGGVADGADAARRRAVARRVLRDFAAKAFRRPADEPTVDRLVALAESVYGRSGKSFEAGVRHAMVAVLSSPRFLFREEAADPAAGGDRFPRVDEYSLASRLSYFLWSSAPDAELLRLAAAGQLRTNQAAQMKRMLADPRADALVANFTGQWLQARDVESVPVEVGRVADREAVRRAGLASDRDKKETRVAMREELERYVGYVVREDRSVLELIDSDYAFVNERLANYYGIPGVAGDDVRRVPLPPDSPRGGVLTAGGVLMVTSNPTRTSPVKRGLFVLENVLGTPPPPPPPDIPPLEDAGKKFKDRAPTLRETLELHRSAAACSSCHSRMDPLGLAFENFNALGLWREKDAGQAVDPAGQLITGEAFKDVRELKRVLVTDRRADVYRCLTEKLLTYALGRGLEYYDVETVDRIVADLEQTGGHFSTLLDGVVNSAPFQRRRAEAAREPAKAARAEPATRREAEATRHREAGATGRTGS